MSNPSTTNKVTNQITNNLNRKISILQDMKNPHKKVLMKIKIVQHLN